MSLPEAMLGKGFFWMMLTGRHSSRVWGRLSKNTIGCVMPIVQMGSDHAK